MSNPKIIKEHRALIEHAHQLFSGPDWLLSVRTYDYDNALRIDIKHVPSEYRTTIPLVDTPNAHIVKDPDSDAKAVVREKSGVAFFKDPLAALSHIASITHIAAENYHAYQEALRGAAEEAERSIILPEDLRTPRE